MHALFVAAALTATPAPVESYTSLDVAAGAIAAGAGTGTLLFSQGDCLAVKVYTRSAYTHVAAVVVEDGRAYVYDSQNNTGVRRLPLEEYLAVERPFRFHVFRPKVDFTERRTRNFIEHLQSQVGRPYAIAHHVTGERADGLHCSEYLTDALIHCHVLRAKQPPRVSPASLVEGLLKGNLYEPLKTVEVRDPPESVADGRCWCEQMWIDTKQCTKRFCRNLSRVFLCR
ncbi:MAG TPA: YiiX/YebB-like N1pC/P60 family cysteine hydrolase [Planctomycetaceae bacterium]|nr:YiiX/YebB-like N1pC/P60 family cysteine hydrolase [Planctomycetaceae bacterium]